MKNFFESKLRFRSTFLFFLALSATVFMTSCGDDDDDGGTTPTGDPIASFQYAISDDNFLEVSFSNFSQNATSYSWNFGDNSGTSSDENPTYVYTAAGTYTVELTATGADNKTSTKSETFTLEDPNLALKRLTGEVSKTWKLYREGTSMSVGSVDVPGLYWAGLTNDGQRPCLYQHEFTFGLDGSYTFNDNGMFWAEFGIFNNIADCDQNTTTEQCFDATPENMVNECGDDVSAWLSGTHSFTYDASNGSLTLSGEGAWIGIPKLQTSGESPVPASSVTTKITITENEGFDVMLVEFIYGEGGGATYWPITYASYSDASLEPELVTEHNPPAWGEDLDDISPTSLSHSFASDDNSGGLDTIASGSIITFGVDDPAGSGDKVGQFQRTATDWQELQFQTSPTKNDINFENLTSFSVDVYVPSNNDFSGSMTSSIVAGFGDRSQTQEWWTNHIEYIDNGANLPLDEWTTVTFQLNAPNNVGNPDNGATPFDRNDLDMFYIGFGGGGHSTEATIFVKNLVIQ